MRDPLPRAGWAAAILAIAVACGGGNPVLGDGRAEHRIEVLLGELLRVELPIGVAAVYKCK